MKNDCLFSKPVLAFVATLPVETLRDRQVLYRKLAAANHTQAAVKVLYLSLEAHHNYVAHIQLGRMSNRS